MLLFSSKSQPEKIENERLVLLWQGLLIGGGHISLISALFFSVFAL